MKVESEVDHEPLQAAIRLTIINDFDLDHVQLRQGISCLQWMHKRVDKFLVYSPFHLIFDELLSVVVLNITFYKISHWSPN